MRDRLLYGCRYDNILALLADMPKFPNHTYVSTK